jgi:hypothetical protein
MMNLYQKLVEVRKSVPYLKKEAQSTQYSYVGSSQVLGAIREKLDEHGILLTVKIENKNVNFREKVNAKGSISYHYEVELDLLFTWINAEKPEETISIPFFSMANDTGDNAKAVGKALTYGEKYFILKQFNIATDKDDPDAFQERSEHYRKPEPAGKVEFDTFNALVTELSEVRNVDPETVHQALGIKDLNKVTKAQMIQYMTNLNSWLQNAKKKQGA